VARETSRVLASRLRGGGAVRLRIVDGSSRDSVNLPATATRLLVRILNEMARGNAVALTPVRAELSTQEAADALNISRPSLIRLLDEGKIAFRRVGAHRRVLFQALMKYKRQADAGRRSSLAELAAYDRELGI
jgi:excisionase family DNA binding protein